MAPAVIFSFLVGAVLASNFRVWILVPLSLIAFLFTLICAYFSGAGLFQCIGSSLLIGITPQFGYTFGLLTKIALSNSTTEPQPDGSTAAPRSDAC